MTTETVSIDVVRFRDQNQRPTCAIGRGRYEVCQFLAYAGHGTAWPTCMASRALLDRRGDGSIDPGKYCIVWGKE